MNGGFLIAALYGDISFIDSNILMNSLAVKKEAIMNSIICGHLNIVKYLIKHLRKEYGREECNFEEILYASVVYNRFRVFKYLTGFINPNRRILTEAIERGLTKFVKYILGSIYIEVDSPMLDRAVRRGHIDVVKLLFKYWRIDFKDALKIAENNNHTGLIKFFKSM